MYNYLINNLPEQTRIKIDTKSLRFAYSLVCTYYTILILVTSWAYRRYSSMYYFLLQPSLFNT